MGDKSNEPEVTTNPIIRPNWRMWKKKSAWRLSDAVALSLNISPSFIEKMKESHPKKYKIFLARLKVVEGQRPGTFEFFEKHLGNGPTHNSSMVSPQSFISFAMSENGWRKLPPGFLEIGKVDDSTTAGIDINIARKGNEKFIPALIKILVEIGNREGKNGNSFSVDSMPGIRTDFYNFACRYDRENLGCFTLSTFNTYIKGMCGFKAGARKSNYYYELFPEKSPTLVAK